MASSLSAIKYGNDYQALVFWKYAIPMLQSDSEIASIGYEYEEFKSFDDVVVHYANSQVYKNSYVDTDYIQVKFHVAQTNKITLASLFNPKFVNSTAFSFMEKAAMAYKKDKATYKRSRFILFTPWAIDTNDPLYELIDNKEASLRVNQLLNLRKKNNNQVLLLTDHFMKKCSISESELSEILSQVCIYANQPAFSVFLDAINYKLPVVQLKPWNYSQVGNPYTSLIESLMAHGVYEFSQESLAEYLVRENLVLPKDSISAPLISAQTVADVKEKYFEYLRYECGKIRLEQMGSVDKKAQDLDKLYVPLRLIKKDLEKTMLLSRSKRNESLSDSILFGEPSSGTTYSSYEYIRELRESRKDDLYEKLSLLTDEIENDVMEDPFSDDLLFDNSDSKIHPLFDETHTFHSYILADPGAGKSTYMKRLVMRFTDESGADDAFCKRNYFPVYIRCRDLKSNEKWSIAKILDHIPQDAGLSLPGDVETTNAFHKLLRDQLLDGNVLLLIDGLDEITDIGKRLLFVVEIRKYLELHKQINCILTSRIVGFRDVGSQLNETFSAYSVDDFSTSDIHQLCVNWYKILDPVNGEKQADETAKMILGNQRIKTLAKNPLLLTTLLVVKLSIGSLPTRRADLYHEFVRLLLRTWNYEAHQQFDLDQATCQLAYVALYMQEKGTQTITLPELKNVLKKARKDLTGELPSGAIHDTPEQFVERIEYRSSILYRKGEEKGVAIYEFQHLTFQEYLAAVALIEGYYHGGDEYEDDYIPWIEKIRNHIFEPSWNEVILLTATLAGRSVVEIVKSIMDLYETSTLYNWPETDNNNYKLSTLLLDILLDEPNMKERFFQDIYKIIFENYFFDDSKMLDRIRRLSKSIYGKDLYKFVRQYYQNDNLMEKSAYVYTFPFIMSVIDSDAFDKELASCMELLHSNDPADLRKADSYFYAASKESRYDEFFEKHLDSIYSICIDNLQKGNGHIINYSLVIMEDLERKRKDILRVTHDDCVNYMKQNNIPISDSFDIEKIDAVRHTLIVKKHEQYPNLIKFSHNSLLKKEGVAFKLLEADRDFNENIPGTTRPYYRFIELSNIENPLPEIRPELVQYIKNQIQITKDDYLKCYLNIAILFDIDLEDTLDSRTKEIYTKQLSKIKPKEIDIEELKRKIGEKIKQLEEEENNKREN